MAVEKSALQVTELDFDQIKDNLKNFLRSQPEFTDYDFEGSGMSVLLDILAYNTHYMGFYLNMIGNEMFIDTAQIRSSILSHAKTVNYVPASRQGATAKVNIKVTPSPSSDENDTVSFITLQKYTKLFSVDKDGVNYPFVTLYSNTASKVNGSFTFANVSIKQGEVITQQFLMEPSNISRRFEIPSANVDITTVQVNVQESASNTDTKTYTLADDITMIDKNSRVYFIEENENLKYTVYFGDNILGKRPKDGSIIIITYLDNQGIDGNNVTRFAFSDRVAGLFKDNVVVTTVSGSTGGLEKETIEEVRFRAPYFYTTQNRAVTKYDYMTLIKKDYDFIDYISVWGGEENDPVIYGKIFISAKTKGNYQLTNFEKERLKTELVKKRGVLTVIPEFVDPDYTYLQIKGKVYYDPKLTTLSANQLKEYVRASIQDYSQDNLNAFDSIFRKTKLETYIENSEPSITSCDIEVYAQKRFKIDPGRKRGYTAKFNFHIQQTDRQRLLTFPTVKIYDASNILRDAYFEDTPNASTGLSEITVSDGGQNYSVAPTVVIVGDGTGASAVARILSGRVQGIQITNPGKNYSFATAVLVGGDGSGATIGKVRLEVETKTLRSFYYDENSVKVIISNDAGSIYNPEGLVTFNNIKIDSVAENGFYDDNILTISSLLDSGTIYPLRNRIITIDDEDARSLIIDVIAE